MGIVMDAGIYQIAFSMLKGMVGATAKEMLRRVGSPEAMFTYSHSQLQALTGVNSEIFGDEYRQQILDRAAKEFAIVDGNSNVRTLFMGDENYPQRMIDCEDAPTLLYECGNVDFNTPYVVGIVGTRHATPYGIDFTTRLVTDLVAMFPGIIIVSGLAFGIDIAAHKAALAANGLTVAVVAHGLETVYPAEHRDFAERIVRSGGSLITEYPTGYRIQRQSFLARNRIVAGISDCIVVVESDVKGGSMATARLAMGYNRDVFALPGRVTDLYSRGTNKLIAQGKAQLITSAQDLASAMMWTPAEQASPSASPTLFRALNQEEQMVYDFIIANPEATENDMCVQLAMPFSRIANIIFTLEMEDFIVKVPGGRYMASSR